MDAAAALNQPEERELAEAGFRPLALTWRTRTYEDPRYGICRDFDTVGRVPEAPGVYAFTLGEGSMVVRYVGYTGHLWMVTLGQIPGAGGRGGQRYGRPRHAGVTRRRVNAALAADAEAGEVVRQWVLPLWGAGKEELRATEESYIARWDLRRWGLNRG